MKTFLFNNMLITIFFKENIYVFAFYNILIMETLIHAVEINPWEDK